MTDEQTPELPADLVALLADDAVWEDLDRNVTEDTIAAVMAEVAEAAPSTPKPELPPPTAPVIDLESRRRPQWSSALLGAAAALLLAVGGFVVLNAVSSADDDPSDISFALEATDLEPTAAGNVDLTTTPNGTRIVLETTGLPPAPEGTYYEAWLRTGPDFGVSAGTFHLRGGGGVEIELWAGVSFEDFPLFTVTLQPVGMTESSGQVVLLARLDG